MRHSARMEASESCLCSMTATLGTLRPFRSQPVITGTWPMRWSTLAAMELPHKRSLVADDAKEFITACSKVHAAHFKGTPGRDTSHGVAERANRTALEWGRPALKQSGLSLAFGSHAIKFGLLNRRLVTANADGVSIYVQKHGPNVPVPPLWAFGSVVTFSPSLRQKVQPKVAPRGGDGILVGYAMQLGGAWSGDYLCISFEDLRVKEAARFAFTEPRHALGPAMHAQGFLFMTSGNKPKRYDWQMPNNLGLTDVRQ